jgi:hypothetical protein
MRGRCRGGWAALSTLLSREAMEGAGVLGGGVNGLLCLVLLSLLSLLVCLLFILLLDVLLAPRKFSSREPGREQNRRMFKRKH